MSLRKLPTGTAASIAASQANGRKSHGRFTKEQIRQAEEIVAKLPVRLLGLAEARVLNQEPGAAERLYRELTAPYGPNLPPLLARNFQDLARLYLELEAWERIRDAQLEQRWMQNHLVRRRLFLEIERDLQATARQVLAEGLESLPDSPAKFRRQADLLELLRFRLEKRDFKVEDVLHYLYGKGLNTKHDRAHAICASCRTLIEAKPGEQPLGDSAFQELLDIVEAEEQEAITAYGLALDEKTMTRAACQARLGPTHEDLWMDRRGERLRQAIDRKQWVIIGLLQAFGLAREARLAPDSGNQPAADDGQQEIASSE